MSLFLRMPFSSLFQIPFMLALAAHLIYNKEYIPLAWITGASAAIYVTITAWYYSDQQRREQAMVMNMLNSVYH